MLALKHRGRVTDICPVWYGQHCTQPHINAAVCLCLQRTSADRISCRSVRSAIVCAAPTKVCRPMTLPSRTSTKAAATATVWLHRREVHRVAARCLIAQSLALLYSQGCAGAAMTTQVRTVAIAVGAFDRSYPAPVLWWRCWWFDRGRVGADVLLGVPTATATLAPAVRPDS